VFGSVVLSSVPQIGTPAEVRNPRGLISSVSPFDGNPRATTRFRSRLSFRMERRRRLPSGSASPEPSYWSLPPPEAGARRAHPPGQLHCLVRATHWTPPSPFLDPSGGGRRTESLPRAASLHETIPVQEFQFEPYAADRPSESAMRFEDLEHRGGLAMMGASKSS